MSETLTYFFSNLEITFKDKNLLKVVKNNKKLISLVLCECPSIKNDTFRNILRLRP